MNQLKELAESYKNNQIWQLVLAIAGILIALLTVFAAYNIYYLERQVKSLQVVILANTSLIDIAPSIASDIAITYKDHSTDNLSLIQIKIENIGNVAIREEDYSRPITFLFPSQAEVIEATILEADPSNLGISAEMEKTSVTFAPALLNEGDKFIARFW